MVKHTLRCHDFGSEIAISMIERGLEVARIGSQNRASPQGVAAKIAASFVARNARAFHHATDSE